MKFKTVFITCSASCALLLNACTNPTSTAGSSNAYYDGSITNLEIIDLDTSQYDSGSNTLIGAVVGAVIGNILNNHTTGTMAGAAIGGVIGNASSTIGNRKNGVRISVDTDNGPLVVDMPFSCKYEVGKKVRLVSNGNLGSVMVEENGKYTTATQDSPSKCQSQYDSILNSN